MESFKGRGSLVSDLLSSPFIPRSANLPPSPSSPLHSTRSLRAHTYYNDYLTSAHLPGPEHPLTYLPLRYFCHPATLPPPPPVYSTMAEELDDFNLLSNDDQSDSYPGQPKIESSEDYLLLDDSSLASSSRNFRSKKRNRVMQSCVACHAQKRKVSLSPHPPRLPLLIPPAV